MYDILIYRVIAGHKCSAKYFCNPSLLLTPSILPLKKREALIGRERLQFLSFLSAKKGRVKREEV
jgi:hypothetical protein